MQNFFGGPYPYATQFSRQQVPRVSGEAGAWGYQLGPDSSILLLDETAPVVWLKTTDAGGYPTVKGFDIMERKPKGNVAFDALEERIKRLEAIVNGKPDNGGDEPEQQ